MNNEGFTLIGLIITLAILSVLVAGSASLLRSCSSNPINERVVYIDRSDDDYRGSRGSYGDRGSRGSRGSRDD